MTPEHFDPTVVVPHSLAIGAVVSSWAWLPPTLAAIASTMAIIFYTIQIYKSLRK